jgi:Protein of unknown function (DUF3017)
VSGPARGRTSAWRTRQPLGAWWLLAAGLAVALWLLLGGGLRGYGYAMAATLVVAAIVRAAVPRERAGGLVVRSRAWDVGLMLTLALAAVVLSSSLVIR